MTDQLIEIKKEGKICSLIMNRPDMIMNAFNLPLMHQLQRALDQIRTKREEIRVVIIEGAGGHFSAGADMFLLDKSNDAPESLNFLKDLAVLIRSIRELPMPVICKVRGVAYGVGVNMALSGDFVIASNDARFCEVFCRIGAIMDGGGTYFLPRLVGLAKAKEIAMLGDEISGSEAAEIGLIYKSVADDKLDEETLKLANRLAANSRHSMALIKEGLEGSFDMTLTEALEWEASHQSIALQTPEHKKAVNDYLSSRGKR